MPPLENYRAAISRVYPSLKSKKRRIADELLGAPMEVISLSVADFAARCQCDQTTVVRFAQQLGYSGFAELKLAVARQTDAIWQELDLPSEPETPEIGSRVADALLRRYCASLQLTLHALDETAVGTLLDRLGAASRVMICGAGASALAAEDLQVKLARQGVPAFAYRDFELWNTFVGYLGEKDLLVCFSNSGETAGVLSVVATARKRNVFIVAIVSYPDSTLARQADLTLHTENRGELPIRLGAMTSRVAQSALVDYLAVRYSMQDKNKTWNFLEQSYAGQVDSDH